MEPRVGGAQLEGELELIEEKHYEPFFLTVHVTSCASRAERGILCQGRGSAANSLGVLLPGISPR